MKVQLSPRARREANRCDAWWRANRQDSPDLFEHELFRALEQIQTAPRSGARYVTGSGRDCRRVLMPRTQHFIYYGIVEPDEVRVVAVWGGQRGKGPAL
jgi:plasmid stabilization system protein ParE